MLYCLMLHHAKKISDDLAKEQCIETHVIDLRTVYPLDKTAIIEAANKTGKILLITEDNLEGSIMSEVSAIIAENCLFQLDAPVRRLAGLDVPSMPYAAPLEKEFMMSEEKIEKAIRELDEF